MDNATRFRGLIYCLGLLGSGAAIWLSMAGYADYDAATGILDIRPISITQAVTQLVSWGGNGVALLAVLRGWGRK